MKISEKLEQLRKEHGETQQELAEEIGVTQSYINKIEKGRKVPNLFTALDIARHYSISVEELVGRSKPET